MSNLTINERQNRCALVHYFTRSAIFSLLGIAMAATFLAGTKAEASVITISRSDFITPVSIDLEGLPRGPIATNDPVFTAIGLTSITTSDGVNGSDVFNNYLDGQCLASVNGSLHVIAEGHELDNQGGSNNPLYRIEYAAPTTRTGLSITDQVGSFTISFYMGTDFVGSTSQSVGGPTPFYLENTEYFNAITIGGASDAGYGIDNITVEGAQVPEPSAITLGLISILGLFGFVRRRDH